MWALTIFLVAFGQISTEPAEPKKEPWELSTPAEELKQLQGSWNVDDSQHSAGITLLLPKETGLAEKGTRLVIRGNELLREGKVIATLANDLSAVELAQEIRPFRRPLLITLPDGRAILCAYDKRHLQKSVDIAYPPTIGNVGAGQRVFLGRPAKEPVEQSARLSLPGEVFAFSPDGQALALGSADGSVQLWDIDTSQLTAKLEGHKGQVRQVAFSSDGKTLVSGSTDKTIKLWDVTTRKMTANWEEHAGEILRLAISRGARRARSEVCPHHSG